MGNLATVVSWRQVCLAQRRLRGSRNSHGWERSSADRLRNRCRHTASLGRSLALLSWSMVHGIAKLAITGRLPYRSKTEILKFAEFVIDESLPVSRRKDIPSQPAHA